MDLSRLDPRPAGFGSCGDCAYKDKGTPEICFACAEKRLDPVPQKRCQVCQLPLKRNGTCGNPICWDHYFDRNYAIAYRRGQLLRSIQLYKNEGRQGWARIFARFLVAYLDEHRDAFAKFDLIVGSPTYVGEE